MVSRWGPVVALAVLAPVSVDVVFGATPVSVPFALVPEILTYGVAAVLVRELVRAGRRPAAAVVLLGVAFAVVSECLVVQTSLSPTPDDGGRWAGVNWPYLVFMLGYIAVWAILVPIRVVETGFADRAWLGRPGRAAFAVLFVAGCVVAWFQWTRIVYPLIEGLPVYDPPWPTLVVSALVAIGLVVAALAVPWRRIARPAPRPAPHPAVLGVLPVVVLAVWVVTTVDAPSGLPPAVGIVVALLAAAGTAVLVTSWVRGPGWSVRHRMAAIAGAYVANSLAGFVVVHHYTTFDLIGKIVVDVAVLVLVGWLARRAIRAERRADPAPVDQTSRARNPAPGQPL